MTQYENQTYEAIKERMFSAISDDIDKRQGSLAHDIGVAPSAAELAQAYIALDDVLSFGFATEDTPDEYLDLRAAELGIYRKPAVQAVGRLTFTGEDGTVIEEGIRAKTDAGEYFVTTESGVIDDGSVSLPAIAEIGGIAGNARIGSISVLLGDLSGVVEVSNEAPFVGGVDEETSESLLHRYRDKAQKPVTSGNANHYVQWAKEVAGVGDAKVFPIWNGAGTVKVVLLDDERKAPAQTVIDAAGAHIEEQRPIGASVTVVGAQEIPIKVAAVLTLASGATLSDVKADIERGVMDYLASLAFKDTLVRYTRIAAILLDIPRIIDYVGLTVNGGTDNIEVADEQVAVLGGVSLDGA